MERLYQSRGRGVGHAYFPLLHITHVEPLVKHLMGVAFSRRPTLHPLTVLPHGVQDFSERSYVWYDKNCLACN